MDDLDLAWLNRVNIQRNAIGKYCTVNFKMLMRTILIFYNYLGSSKVSELAFEQTMEELERQSWANMQTLLKTEEFCGIEYDENVICDVCRAVHSLSKLTHFGFIVNLFFCYLFIYFLAGL